MLGAGGVAFGIRHTSPPGAFGPKIAKNPGAERIHVGAASPLGYRLSRRVAIGAVSASRARAMASKTPVMPHKEEVPETAETSPDRPLLDLADAGVKKLIRIAKKRGYVTHDQINSVLRSEAVSSEQMEDVLAMFSEKGINVVEAAEAEPDEDDDHEEVEAEESAHGEIVEVQRPSPANVKKAE